MIRSIGPHEVEILLPGARSFFAEGAMPGTLNEAHFTKILRNLVATDTGMIIASFNEEGFITGGIAGAFTPEFATGDLAATEFFWYVLPQYRMHGLKLLRAFESEAARRKCVRIHMVHLANDKAPQLEEIYPRQGYRYLEKVYTKELPG